MLWRWPDKTPRRSYPLSGLWSGRRRWTKLCWRRGEAAEATAGPYPLDDLAAGERASSRSAAPDTNTVTKFLLLNIQTYVSVRSYSQVLEEAVAARFRSVSYLHTRGPGLAGHLSALQHGIMADLATVRHLLEHCVPQHYKLTGAYLRASHRCLHAHLTQVGEMNNAPHHEYYRSIFFCFFKHRPPSLSTCK